MRLTILALLMLTQCVCSSNKRPTESDAAPEPRPDVTAVPQPDAAPAPPEEKPKLKLPASLATKDLDDDEKLVLQSVLEEQYDPCGKARSFLDSLAAPDTCDEAKKLAALAVDKIAEGLSKKQVVQEILKEQARWASKADFDFTGSPVHGEPAAGKRVVVEFFDFQCPHCKLAAKPAKEIAEKKGAVLYYKMLPLEIHPVAKEAALMALAANRQGKFSALSELFFDNQERLDGPLLRELAQKAGLDLAKLDADMKDPGVVALLERDMAEATRAKIDGTPTFFVDGYQVELEQLESKL